MFIPTRACELLIGLSEANILDVTEPLPVRLEATIKPMLETPVCPGCRERASVKDRRVVELVDLTCLGRPVRLRWPTASASTLTPLSTANPIGGVGNGNIVDRGPGVQF